MRDETKNNMSSLAHKISQIVSMETRLNMAAVLTGSQTQAVDFCIHVLLTYSAYWTSNSLYLSNQNTGFILTYVFFILCSLVSLNKPKLGLVKVSLTDV